MEVPGVVPTVVVEDEEEEFLLEVGVSRKETKSNQAEGTGRLFLRRPRREIQGQLLKQASLLLKLRNQASRLILWM